MSEKETMMNMVADDRSYWEVFSDDEVMQARLEKVGAELIRTASSGEGKFYRLRTDQVHIRKGKRQYSEEEKVRMVAQLHSRPKPSRSTGDETP